MRAFLNFEISLATNANAHTPAQHAPSDQSKEVPIGGWQGRSLGLNAYCSQKHPTCRKTAVAASQEYMLIYYVIARVLSLSSPPYPDATSTRPNHARGIRVAILVAP